MSKQIGILGCGWLGTPLAESLISKGYRIKGSTTRGEKLHSLAEKGIEGQKIRLNESQIEGDITGFLKGLDCLVLNIPPGLRGDPGADFTGRIRNLEAHLKKAGVVHLVFVSSTSVYGNSQGNVCEKDPPHPDSETGRQLLETETLLLSNTTRKTQVVRPGGLLGPDRHPVFSLSGKSFDSGGNNRVNLIRLSDLLKILEVLISGNSVPGTYNAVYPEHPSKRDFYTAEASHFGISPPYYSDAPGPLKGKKIHCRALEAIGYTMAHSIWTEKPGSGIQSATVKD